MLIPNSPGLYIVTLNNEDPISVNAQDPRMADRAIRVTRDNCKVGKAKNLAARERNYQKTFGPKNVNFYPFALTHQIEAAERLILASLGQYRIRGSTGRLNEWLENVAAADALSIARGAIVGSGIDHELIDVEALR